jgi:hypothetical protein
MHSVMNSVLQAQMHFVFMALFAVLEPSRFLCLPSRTLCKSFSLSFPLVNAAATWMHNVRGLTGQPKLLGASASCYNSCRI